jgi:RimJ/RimL family protein N-acetyltransferase
MRKRNILFSLQIKTALYFVGGLELDGVVTALLKEKDTIWVPWMLDLIKNESTMLKREAPEIEEAIIEGRCVASILNGEPIGFCFFWIWPDTLSGNDLIEVGGLMVLSGFRRNGLAQELIQETTRIARERHPSAFIFCLAYSEASTKAFETSGYQRIDLQDILRQKDVLESCKTCPCPCWEGGRFTGCEMTPMAYLQSL